MDHLSMDNLPISYQPGTSQLFVPSSQISSAGRALLLASGCTVSYWEDMLDLMSGKLDLSQDGEKLRDITAYALRRDFASRAANSCGVTERELDLALGHKIRCSAVEKRAFYGLPSLSAFRQKLENYIFDPKHTAPLLFADCCGRNTRSYPVAGDASSAVLQERYCDSAESPVIGCRTDHPSKFF